MTRSEMESERERLAGQLRDAQALLWELREDQEAAAKTVDRLEHQVQLWDDLIKWELNEDPRPEF